MDETKLPDLTINGMGRASGGNYRKVEIEGIGSAEGDVSCETFRANGVVTIRGSVRAGHFEMNGKMNGEGSLSAQSVVAEGHLNLRGRMHGDEVKLNGYVKLQGDCEAERFYLNGGFTVDGLLNGGSIDIVLYGRGQAKEIGGEFIQVQKSRNPSGWSRMFAWIIPAFEPHLFAGTIEGDDIRLEETTADTVRGNRVYIGPGCKIARVEYLSELVVHPDASVTEQFRS